MSPMIQQNSRRTNVVWSFESRCFNDSLIEAFKEDEVDAIRLVSETGDMSSVFKFVGKINQAFAKSDQQPPIVIDLSQVRGFVIGLTEPRDVAFGDKVIFGKAGDKGAIKIRCHNFATFFAKGATIFLGNGSVVMNPVELADEYVVCEVVQGGVIYPEMEIHVPKTREQPSFQDIPKEDLESVCASKVDFLVVPAFERIADLEKLHEYLKDKMQSPPWLLVKVDGESVYESLAQILPKVQGVLISRVELAMTMDPARVPMVTKEIIQLCNDQAKIVLLASEILGSMRHNATPTRAEVSDIANAVLDGADGVVLSEDLPYGDYARRGLMLAKKTVEEVESHESSQRLNWIKHTPAVTDELEAITYNAYRSAQRNKAKAIVCITKQGNTALLLSSFRAQIPIIAVTMSKEVLRRLRLVRGVWGLVLEDVPNINEILPIINDRLVNDGWLRVGDKIIFVSVSLSSIGSTASNLFTIQTLR